MKKPEKKPTASKIKSRYDDKYGPCEIICVDLFCYELLNQGVA